jgi:hypothetical protein
MISIERLGRITQAHDTSARDIRNPATHMKRSRMHVHFGAKMQKERNDVSVAMQRSQHEGCDVPLIDRVDVCAAGGQQPPDERNVTTGTRDVKRRAASVCALVCRGAEPHQTQKEGAVTVVSCPVNGEVEWGGGGGGGGGGGWFPDVDIDSASIQNDLHHVTSNTATGT